MKIYMIEQTYFDGAEFWKNPEAHYDSIEKAREHIVVVLVGNYEFSIVEIDVL